MRKKKLLSNRVLMLLALGLLGFGTLFPQQLWAKRQTKAHAVPPIPATLLSPLEKAVRHELLMLPYYGVFDNLEFKVDGDVVTLSGQVVRPILSHDAQHAVERISGVSKVINHIEVLPLSPFDDRIRLMTYRRIYGDQALLRYAILPIPSIRIIVKNGNVTLKGMVSNAMDQQLAFMAANSVGGVFSVTNELKVQS